MVARSRMSVASLTDRLCACLSGCRLIGDPVPEDQYMFIVLTMVGTLAARTSRRFSRAEASWPIRSTSTPTSSLIVAFLVLGAEDGHGVVLVSPDNPAVHLLARSAMAISSRWANGAPWPSWPLLAPSGSE